MLISEGDEIEITGPASDFRSKTHNTDHKGKFGMVEWSGEITDGQAKRFGLVAGHYFRVKCVEDGTKLLVAPHNMQGAHFCCNLVPFCVTHVMCMQHLSLMSGFWMSAQLSLFWRSMHTTLVHFIYT